MQRAQTTTTMTKTKTLLPQELLRLAGTHEKHEVQRYRLLALRFLPFNTGISRLLETLASECERRRHEMEMAAQCLPVSPAPASGAVSPRAHIDVPERHFFIVDEGIAALLLSQALADEHLSLHFYRQLLAANATPELYPVFSACIRQVQSQCRVLQESQAHWLLSEWRGERRRSA